jgi:retinol dehydrogenase-12
VTGGASGLGFLLTKFLYQVNGTVYIAGRSQEAGAKAIERIKSQCLDSKGRLEFLHLDLADLSSTKKSADEFLGRERRLDVLWHNAGVMFPPVGSKTKQVCMVTFFRDWLLDMKVVV